MYVYDFEAQFTPKFSYKSITFLANWTSSK